MAKCALGVGDYPMELGLHLNLLRMRNLFHALHFSSRVVACDRHAVGVGQTLGNSANALRGGH